MGVAEELGLGCTWNGKMGVSRWPKTKGGRNGGVIGRKKRGEADRVDVSE